MTLKSYSQILRLILRLLSASYSEKVKSSVSEYCLMTVILYPSVVIYEVGDGWE